VFDSNADITKLTSALKSKLPDLAVRQISDIRTGGQRGFYIETKENSDVAKSALEEYLGYKLTDANSSIEFSGSSISSGFYQQLINSIFAAFILMGCVVFIIFGASSLMKGIALMLSGASIKILIPGTSTIVALSMIIMITGFFVGIWGKPGKQKRGWLMLLVALAASVAAFSFSLSGMYAIVIQVVLLGIYTIYSVPSIAVVLSAFADIVMTIVVVDMMGMTLSSAGIIAFLMLIGYSVDTDILLTSRVIKKQEGTINERVLGAFKTGITMTLTSIVAVTIPLIMIHSLSSALTQIFTILLIGLGFDIFNTWVTNASLIKWYAERKQKHETHN
jgi:preprotein translocase subunit SecF